MRCAPLLLLALGACATTRAAPAPVGDLRLAQDARPLRYAVELTLDPRAPALAGTVTVELELPTPRDQVVLHAAELSVRDVRVTVAGQTRSSTAHRVDAERIAVELGGPLRGRVSVRLDFSGRVLEHDERGVFSRRRDGDAYLFTQFQNTDARRAFPCIDEPGFKVPWHLSLRVPSGDRAFANAPLVAEEPPDEHGMRWVRFAETPPMPSYLVAFAVGPFDAVEIGRFGGKKTPIRVVVPRGASDRAAAAKAITGEALERLEAWFGTPYPFDKLDVVAVPDLSFGAMENAGLITFSEPALLASEAERTPAFERYLSAVMIHEIAHQWFGNLVTMAWWDDLWLNEAFASWMEGTILRQWRPEWAWEAITAVETQHAFRGDALASARTVRQPILNAHDLENAFGTITYLKGQAIVGMFEGWVGAERFKAGVARYLERHAWGSANARDFARALGEAAGREIEGALGSFIDQVGVPLLRFERVCDGDGARLLVRAAPLKTLGSPPIAPRRWRVPVVLELPSGRVEALVEGDGSSIALSDCPAWIQPNAGGTGYYVSALDDRSLLAPPERLTIQERLARVRDEEALARAGDLPIDLALSSAVGLLADGRPQLARAAVGLVRDVGGPLVPDALEPAFAREVRETFGRAARALGFAPIAGESDEVRLLRPELLRLVAEQGEDPALLAEADARARRWLDGDADALTEDLIDVALALLAQRGDRALFARMHAEAKSTDDDRRRAHLLAAMAASRDPAIVEASMSIFLSDDFASTESISLLYQDLERGEVALRFIDQRFDAITERMPAESRSSLLWLTSRFCDERQRALAVSVFGARIDRLGGPRPFAEAIEAIDQCIATRSAQRAAIERWLRAP